MSVAIAAVLAAFASHYLPILGFNPLVGDKIQANSVAVSER